MSHKYTIELEVFGPEDREYGDAYFDVTDAIETIPYNIIYSIKEHHDASTS